MKFCSSVLTSDYFTIKYVSCLSISSNYYNWLSETTLTGLRWQLHSPPPSTFTLFSWSSQHLSFGNSMGRIIVFLFLPPPSPGVAMVPWCLHLYVTWDTQTPIQLMTTISTNHSPSWRAGCERTDPTQTLSQGSAHWRWSWRRPSTEYLTSYTGGPWHKCSTVWWSVQL